MFKKEDFDNVSNIEFNDDFVIDKSQKSRIIFGYNGIGKSSIYKCLKNKFNEYDFLTLDGFDYRDSGLFPLFDSSANKYLVNVNTDRLHINKHGHYRLAKLIASSLRLWL